MTEAIIIAIITFIGSLVRSIILLYKLTFPF